MENLQLTPINILSLFETDKTQRLSFVQQVFDAVDSGNTNPLEAHLWVKNLEEILKAITGNDRFKNQVIDEANRHGSKSFQFHNATIQVKEAGTKYDWSVCDDPELVRLQMEFDKAKAALEERQKFLKNAPASGIEVLADGGEIVRVYPPCKTSSTIISVTLK